MSIKPHGLFLSLLRLFYQLRQISQALEEPNIYANKTKNYSRNFLGDLK